MTRSTVRVELLLAAAAMLAGAVAGVIVQAGVEVARDRRAQRGQLQAAGELVEQLAAERDQLDRECASLFSRLMATREAGKRLRDELSNVQSEHSPAASSRSSTPGVVCEPATTDAELVREAGQPGAIITERHQAALGRIAAAVQAALVVRAVDAAGVLRLDRPELSD